MSGVQEAIRTDRLEPSHILLLEDELSVARGLRMILDESGYGEGVELAVTGQSALAAVKQRAFDLLIADLRLPDIDGMDVIRQVKRDRPETDVVVITGYSTVSSAVEAMKLGARDYLSKPFTEDEFLTVVKTALRPKKGIAPPAVRPEAKRPLPDEPIPQLLSEDPARVDALVSETAGQFAGKPDAVIPMLQMLQERIGYLPEHGLEEIARITHRSPAAIFGIATFYEQFRFAPCGRHVVRVCRGTACHIKGSDQILSEIQNRLSLAPGATTEDRMFTLETVACFGSCAIAPVMVTDRSVHGRMNPSKACEILGTIRNQEQDAQRDTEKGPPTK